MKEDMTKYIRDIAQDTKLDMDKLNREICDTSTYH